MEIRSAKYLISSPSIASCPKPDRAEYAFIGRSNVGKSSLINMLTNQNGLAKTSASPGKTQMINHFEIVNDKNEAFYFVDLPGYGYAKVSQTQRAKWQKMIQQYLSERENLMTVFVLVDSRHDPQKADLEFLRNLGEWEVPFNVIFTKADKSSQREASKNARNFVNAMKLEWEFIPRSFVTSAVKSSGRKDILNFIGELNDSFKTASL